jgi:hypothetical protein
LPLLTSTANPTTGLIDRKHDRPESRMTAFGLCCATGVTQGS